MNNFPDETQTFEKANLTISGWGYTSSNGILSPRLKYAFVNGWNNTACKATGYGKLITDNMIFASTPAIDTDACQGDSGGNLYIFIVMCSFHFIFKNLFLFYFCFITSKGVFSSIFLAMLDSSFINSFREYVPVTCCKS